MSHRILEGPGRNTTAALLLLCGWVIGWFVLFAMWAVVLWELKTRWHITSTSPYTLVFWGAGVVASLSVMTIAFASISSQKFKRWWHDCSGWYWFITGTIFCTSLGWAITSWQPTGLTGWLGWGVAVLMCIAMAALWFIAIVVVAVNHEEREFHRWLQAEEHGAET